MVKKKFTLSTVVIYAVLIVLMLITVYPVLFILSMSFSGDEHLILQDVYFFPKDFSISSYEILFRTGDIWIAYWNTVKYTVVGTAIGLSSTVMLSYAVSQKKFHARKYVIWFVMLTMFFSSGIIPLYILIQGLGMMDTIWAIVLPGAVNAWNMIITRTYFQSLSPAVFESAELDGASEFRKLWSIGIPLGKPIIAVLFLYMVVGFWNTYFTSMLYLDTVSKLPIQNYLQKLLTDGNFSGVAVSGSSSSIVLEKLKYSAIVITMFPIMVIYPFLQKYFVNGIMVGSIKD